MSRSWKHQPRPHAPIQSNEIAGQPARVPRCAGIVLAVASGACWVLALPPIGWWPLGMVAVALLRGVVRGQRARDRAAFGFMTGLVVFGVTLRWATTFTVPGFVLLALVQAVFLAVALAATPGTRADVLALPGALTLAEVARHRFPLSGLPLSGLDLTQVGGPLLPLAGIVGPFALVLASAVAGGALHGIVEACFRHDRRSAASRAAALVLGLVVVAFAPKGLGTHTTGDIDVAVVQGGGTRGTPAVRSSDREVFQRHLDTSRQLRLGVDLVVWPENVVDVPGPFEASREAEVLGDLARDLEAVVLVGVVTDADNRPDVEGIRRFRNLAVEITPAGRVDGTYDKVIRVPFGEYVPWRGLVGRIADLSLIPREAVPGTRSAVLDTDVGRVGVSISFEGLFSSRARAAVLSGAELLVNPTNAASYVTDDVPAQQVAAGRLRAVESGRSVAIASPTGISALIDPSGSVLALSRLETPSVLQAPLPRRNGRTPYVVVGDRPVVVVAASLIAIGWWWRRRHPIPRRWWGVRHRRPSGQDRQCPG